MSALDSWTPPWQKFLTVDVVAIGQGEEAEPEWRILGFAIERDLVLVGNLRCCDGEGAVAVTVAAATDGLPPETVEELNRKGVTRSVSMRSHQALYSYARTVVTVAGSLIRSAPEVPEDPPEPGWGLFLRRDDEG